MMKWDRILVRYGELSTKGRNRRQFTNRLRDNIRFSFEDVPTLKLQAERDRMFLTTETDQDMETLHIRLPAVFGIQSFSPVAKTEKTIDAMAATTIAILSELETSGKTCKVTVKRSDKSFPHETNEIQHLVASQVLRHFEGLTAKMKHPDYNIKIEILQDAAFISAQTILGAGGMPVGSNGRSLLMLSGGIDSPVAGYMMLKRGVRLDAIHFHSPPYTSERSLDKVKQLAEKLSHFGATVRLHVIPFTEIQEVIQQQIPKNVSMTTTRRMMLKIADLVREDIGALAIVTGESLGQVASQTLESLTAINEVTATPVLRPLIAEDKTTIIQLAQEIGTYETSILPFEDCCTIFVPSSPKTKPKLEKVTFYESFESFDSYVEKAVENREVFRFPEKKQKESFDDLL